MNELKAYTADSELIQNRELVRAYLDSVPEKIDLQDDEIAAYREKILELLPQKNAVLVAHYYTDPAIQALAEESGGCVADSLEMARFGNRSEATTVIVAGVRFMGETAKILNPEKTVLMPTLEATCSLDIGCPIEEFKPFCEARPDHKVVVYANTSAAVKAISDWVVTSSIAVDVIEHLLERGEKIIWAPDKHLGRYISRKLDAGDDMLLWDGACIVHEEFKFRALKQLMHVYPEAAVLAHPESPLAILELADVVGSTTQIIDAVKNRPEKRFIIATEQGIFYKMQQAAPDKELIMAPTSGEGATCRSCAHCPWMGMNSLQNLYDSLAHGGNELIVDPETAKKAMIPLQRMLDFRKAS